MTTQLCMDSQVPNDPGGCMSHGPELVRHTIYVNIYVVYKPIRSCHLKWRNDNGYK